MPHDFLVMNVLSPAVRTSSTVRDVKAMDWLVVIPGSAPAPAAAVSATRHVPIARMNTLAFSCVFNRLTNLRMASLLSWTDQAEDGELIARAPQLAGCPEASSLARFALTRDTTILVLDA